MIVFKTFMKMIWKLKVGIVIYTGIFFLFTLLSSTGLQQDQQMQFRNTALEYEVVVKEKSEISEALIDYLSRENTVRVIEASESELREKVFIGSIDVGIILPENLNQHILEKRDAVIVIANENHANSQLANFTINSFFTFSGALLKDQAFSSERIASIMAKEASIVIESKEHNLQNQPAVAWSKFYFNFTSYILLMMLISLLGTLLSQFQATEVFDRQLISPLSPLQINMQKFAGLVLAGVMITSIFIIGVFAFKPELIHSTIIWQQIGLTFVFMICALSITFLISVLVGNRTFLYSGLSTVVSLGLSATSGVMLPIEYLDPSVLTVAKFFPLYHFVDANQKLVDHSGGISNNVFIILLFSAFYLLLAFSFSKILSGRRKTV